MTFYNVISALLFIGCLRILLLALDTARWGSAAAVGCLVVLVFNDMLSTSHRVESAGSLQYTLRLMIIDLVNFLLLALAMIVASPDRNMFDVPLNHIASVLGPSSYWLLLAAYWLSLMLWTRVADGETSKSVLKWQASVALTFLVQWLFSVLNVQRGATLIHLLALGYLVLYMTWLRTRVRSAAGLAQ